MKTAQAIDQFLVEQQLRNNSPATVEAYRSMLTLWLGQAHVKCLTQITRESLAQWRLGLQERDLSPATVKTYVKHVRIFCSWAVRAGLMQTNPMLDLPPVRVPAGTGEFVTFTKEDVQRMVKAAGRERRPTRLRDVAIIATLLDSGMRAGELASIKLPNVSWAERTILVSGKTGRREVPVLTCLRHVRRYVEHERRVVPGEQALFTTRLGAPMVSKTVTHLVRTLAADARVGATKTGPHTFRHTFAVEYLRNGGDVFSLMRLLGHRELETTQRYVHWLMPDLSSAHARHSPANRWL